MKTLDADHRLRVIKPLRVLEEQADLIRWMRFNRFADSIVEGFADSMRIKGKESGGFFPIAPGKTRLTLTALLDQSEAVFVSGRIMEVLWPFVQDHEIDEVVIPEHLPIRYAFAYLEHPIQITDVRGNRMVIQAIQWACALNGLILITYGNSDSMNDDINLSLRKEIETWGVSWTEVSPHLPIMHVQSYPFGKSLQLTPDFYHVPADVLEDSRPITQDTVANALEDMNALLRFYMALWSFMSEEIPARREAGPKLQSRLSKAKVGFPAQVKIVDLRRQAPGSTSPDWDPLQVAWTHRWRSKEHLGWRWKGSKKDGTWHRERVPIRGSIKGPAHLPLVEKETVFYVRR